MQIWPQPTGSVSLSTTAVPVRADSFQLQLVSAPSKAVHEHIQNAFQIFREDLSNMESKARGFEEWHSVNIRIAVNSSGDPRMRLDTDESYSLSLRPSQETTLALTVDIIAPSFCGSRHALETLLQLVWLDTYMGSLLMLEAAKVNDTPRFRYRGILVDTARNFFPIKELIQNIDAMAASKLNTFHWHMSDSQAFPLHINSLPQLVEHGAHSSSDVYTIEEVRDLVRRARLRGIRVLIEIDAPAHVGHAWNFGSSKGLGDLIYCLNDEPWNKYCSEPPCGQLNPRNPHVYDILAHLYKEILQITGVDDILHLGGDDISERCWKEHFSDSDPSNLWLEYTYSILDHLESEMIRGKLPNLTIFWLSPLTERFKSHLKKYIENVGIQIRCVVWSYKHLSGIRTIMSHEDAWDLNTGFGKWYEESNGAPYNSWQRVYEHRPWLKHSVGIVEGGEATVWSAILGEGNLMSRIWPRAAALAERLWTDRPEGATRPVHARLDVHRSRLVARGYKVSPLWSMWCTHNTYMCV